MISYFLTLAFLLSILCSLLDIGKVNWQYLLRSIWSSDGHQANLDKPGKWPLRAHCTDLTKWLIVWLTTLARCKSTVVIASPPKADLQADGYHIQNPLQIVGIAVT